MPDETPTQRPPGRNWLSYAGAALAACAFFAFLFLFAIDL
ncbi:MAG: hypothetical protein RL616_1338, partial [Verrucomicrobiota bacterium]